MVVALNGSVIILANPGSRGIPLFVDHFFFGGYICLGPPFNHGLQWESTRITMVKKVLQLFTFMIHCEPAVCKLQTSTDIQGSCAVYIPAGLISTPFVRWPEILSACAITPFCNISSKPFIGSMRLLTHGYFHRGYSTTCDRVRDRSYHAPCDLLRDVTGMMNGKPIVSQGFWNGYPVIHFPWCVLP